MRYLTFLLLVGSLFSTVSAQSRQEIIEQLNNLTNQTKKLEGKILSPDESDVETAQQENVEVFRIMPRETYEKVLFSVRGGGAYYSFVKKSHSYNETPQIELCQNRLSVGFYGASYGLLADLGEVNLNEINVKDKDKEFLLNYRPAKYDKEVSEEYRKIGNGFEIGGIKYTKYLPAVEGHSYLLRAISYDEADTIVAFQIRRKEKDGSLIIFWKMLENFEKPVLIRSNQ